MIEPFTGIRSYCLAADPAVQPPTGRMGALYFCFPQPQHDIHTIFYRMVDLHLSPQGWVTWMNGFMGCFSVGYELEGNLACFPTAVLPPWWLQGWKQVCPSPCNSNVFGLQFNVAQGWAPLRTTLEPSKAYVKTVAPNLSSWRCWNLGRAEISLTVQLGS